MPNVDLKYRLVAPGNPLSDFVYGFSALQNVSHIDEGIIIPNGKVDLFFSITYDQQFHIGLMGLETQPKSANIRVSAFFAINFNPLAIEYIFQCSVADILNSGKELPDNFWDFSVDDLMSLTGNGRKSLAFRRRL